MVQVFIDLDGFEKIQLLLQFCPILTTTPEAKPRRVCSIKLVEEV